MPTDPLNDHDQAVSWMYECLELARQAATTGGYPLGALVARPGEGVIARSGSSLIAGTDPTAHPEIEALRIAAQKEESRYVPGAFLVTTLEPCVMCTGAAIWAKLQGIVYGASQADAIAWSDAHPHPLYTWRQIRISCRAVIEQGEPKLDVIDGILRDRCLKLFTNPRNT